jgi:quinol monooxygenase YgiN
MTEICTVVAVFSPKPEHYKEVHDLLLRITPLVHEEPGCEFYTMNEDSEGRFVHIEAWATRQDWIDHMQQPTVKEILSTVEGKLQREVEVYELYNVPTGTSGKGSLSQADPAA